ncbi:hypothetical protein GIB67_014128, partial [Kingdonia uniflora]
MGNPINTNVILESDHSATTVIRPLFYIPIQQQKQVSSNHVLSTQQCRIRKVDVAISDSGGTSIDQFVKQNRMGLTISNPGISNTINRDISQACLLMNTTLLATGNPIDTNAILESDQSVIIANPSAIVFANTE